MQDLIYSRQSALETLQALGFDGAATAAPHAGEGGDACHLCHASYAHCLHDCVCPHWLVMPWPSLERIREVLATYDLAAILHFLLVYTKPKTGKRRTRADLPLVAATGAARRQVRIKAQRRSWAFSMPSDPADPACALEFRLRAVSSKEFETAFAPKDGDVALLRALTGA